MTVHRLRYASNRSLLKTISSLKLTVLCLAFLMILTFVGTIYQANHGLYAAQQTVFYSWFFLLGDVLPLPGVRLVLWVLSANLIAALIARFRYSWKNTGLFLSHLGLIFLLVGSFVKFHYSKHSHLTLKEGEGANVSASYMEWELALFEHKEGSRHVAAVDVNGVKPGQVFEFDRLNLRAEVLWYAPHSEAYKGRQTDLSLKDPPLNASGIEKLQWKPLLKEREKNVAGLIVRLSSAQLKDDLTYILYGLDPKLNKISLGDKEIFITLRQKKLSLPVYVELMDVTQEKHPHTEIASHYESRVKVEDGDIAREVVISMNKPMRIGHHTFYQASYGVDAEGRELSVLAVAKSPWALLPYVASLMILVGLMGYFIVKAIFHV